MTICTRFAPSPTGYLHIGGARTALFSWLYARKQGGNFILRIEDTDLERSSIESVNAILDSMAWLGLDYDQGPFYQTERFSRYQEIINQLTDSGHAYRCYCSKEELEIRRTEQIARKEKPRYDGKCRHLTTPKEGIPYVIRFKNSLDGQVQIRDLVRGTVIFQNGELDDLIIARTDGTPTYNLTVVVDDMDMGITHVIRGDDHLNNTPRQSNIFAALGKEPPSYAHIPMILGTDKQRLSKRHGAVSVMSYRDLGYLPEALLNYLVRLGWSHGDQEVFTIEEMIKLFNIKDINQSASVFNPEKLQWLNQHYIKNSDPHHIAQHLYWYLEQLKIDISQGPNLIDLIKAQQERAKTLVEMAQNCVPFYYNFQDYESIAAEKHLTISILEPLQALKAHFENVSSWTASEIHQAISSIVEKYNLKLAKLAQPLRVAVMGRPISPPIDITLELLGKEKTLSRVERAIEWIQRN
ncbi:glutamate--tRNA ligase [Candidatus Nitrosacidococcus tergens]|uniref:Glutamate--tRNA ligase n=1 Tax=Candidatus Nitrosacidococcus tergens TaxID=553981 RepID=A0A7G1Q7D4_9GAMM|nr:glutamate--tRNA ligase [Candidatus Nitrosacidococcus tergens]CAB1274271.1 glutamyl-tRNA synthetase [Candidatus Nitrosacidococcus tergens]